MSKNNNVNPGQYKLAGRERPGDGIAHEENKAAESMKEHELREQARRHKDAPREGEDVGDQ